MYAQHSVDQPGGWRGPEVQTAGRSAPAPGLCWESGHSVGQPVGPTCTLGTFLPPGPGGDGSQQVDQPPAGNRWPDWAVGAQAGRPTGRNWHAQHSVEQHGRWRGPGHPAVRLAHTWHSTAPPGLWRCPAGRPAGQTCKLGTLSSNLGRGAARGSTAGRLALGGARPGWWRTQAGRPGRGIQHAQALGARSGRWRVQVGRLDCWICTPALCRAAWVEAGLADQPASRPALSSCLGVWRAQANVRAGRFCTLGTQSCSAVSGPGGSSTRSDLRSALCRAAWVEVGPGVQTSEPSALSSQPGW